MRQWLLLLLIFFHVVFWCGSLFAGEINFQTGFNYDWWKSDNHTKGEQFYIPIQLDTEVDNFSAKVLTAFATTQFDLAEIDDTSLSCIVDTKLNLSYEISGNLPFGILIGLDFNLPTGTTRQENEDYPVTVDPDLTGIVSMGEGFNINPTITIAREWTQWAAGLGAGYLWRGQYDFSDEVRDYDPGEIAHIVGEVRHYFSDDFFVKILGDYGFFTKDRVENHDFYKEADFLMIAFESRYVRQDWEIWLNMKSIYRGKSEFQEADLKLASESRKSYGDEYVVDFAYAYNFNRKTTLRPFMQFLYIAANDYPEDAVFYIGTREKYTLGLSLTQRLRENLTLECMIHTFRMEDEKAWLSHEDVSYRGNSFLAKIIGKF